MVKCLQNLYKKIIYKKIKDNLFYNRFNKKIKIISKKYDYFYDYNFDINELFELKKNNYDSSFNLFPLSYLDYEQFEWIFTQSHIPVKYSFLYSIKNDKLFLKNVLDSLISEKDFWWDTPYLNYREHNPYINRKKFFNNHFALLKKIDNVEDFFYIIKENTKIFNSFKKIDFIFEQLNINFKNEDSQTLFLKNEIIYKSLCNLDFENFLFFKYLHIKYQLNIKKSFFDILYDKKNRFNDLDNLQYFLNHIFETNPLLVYEFLQSSDTEHFFKDSQQFEVSFYFFNNLINHFFNNDKYISIIHFENLENLKNNLYNNKYFTYKNINNISYEEQIHSKWNKFVLDYKFHYKFLNKNENKVHKI